MKQVPYWRATNIRRNA